VIGGENREQSEEYVLRGLGLGKEGRKEKRESGREETRGERKDRQPLLA
jgi:hypothetical protein